MEFHSVFPHNTEFLSLILFRDRNLHFYNRFSFIYVFVCYRLFCCVLQSNWFYFEGGVFNIVYLPICFIDLILEIMFVFSWICFILALFLFFYILILLFLLFSGRPKWCWSRAGKLKTPFFRKYNITHESVLWHSHE